PMELLRAALGKDADLSAGGAAVFGRVAGGEDLNLLCGIYIGRAQAGAVGPRSHRRCAIVRDEAFGSAGAVDVVWALAEIEGKAGEVAATRAPYQVRHKDRVAPVQFQSIDLFSGDVTLHRCRFRLE